MSFSVFVSTQEVSVPDVLYEEVIEVDERVVLRQDGCQLPRKDPRRTVTGVVHNSERSTLCVDRQRPRGHPTVLC